MMRKQILTLLGAGLIGLMHPAASQATLLDFTFTFTNDGGNVPGTVTGEIFGLTDNATGPATNVILTSYPAGLELPAPPQTVFTGLEENSFTVTAGEITDAGFEASDTTGNIFLALNGLDTVNELINVPAVLILGNSDGFAGAAYTPVQSTPEPLSGTILGTGLGLAALWQLRQRSRRQRAAA